MTVYRIDHAVVMDTDHIPGRGGYAVVGVSPEVWPAERAFIAQNFGISDYLHNPQLQKQDEHRIFYSFFRIPGGRRALVRRFAKGVRRNQTQNRLFVHTLLIDDDLFERFEGLPWLLVNATLRPEGVSSSERLTDEVPWVSESVSIPRLEWDDGTDRAADDVADSLRKRLDLLSKQLAARASSGEDAVASVITALSREQRVVLPQGRGYELLTMLAWSMLPWQDREDIAWTQHDTMNISGVAFGLANAVSGDTDALEIEGSPFAFDIVHKSESEETWHDFQERSRLTTPRLTVRDADTIARWLEWRNGVDDVRKHLDAPERQVVAAMSRLAAIAAGREGAPWIDRKEILQLIWNRIPAARLRASGLHQVIFRAAPEQQFLEHAAEENSVDAVVAFVLAATADDPALAPARNGIASWIAGSALMDVSTEQLADLALRVAADRSPSAEPLLEHLLRTDNGLVTLMRKTPLNAPDAIFAATPIVLQRGHRHTHEFLTHVFLRHLESMPGSRARVSVDLACAVAKELREKPSEFIAFAKGVSPGIRDELVELTIGWLYAEPERTRTLGRELMPLAAHGANAAPLAIALANAAEPARSWLRVLIAVASSIDETDQGNAEAFHQAVNRLGSRTLKLEGAMEPLIEWLHGAAEQHTQPGSCMRALMRLLRPAWRSRALDLLGLLAGFVRRSSAVREWEPLVSDAVEQFGNSGGRTVSSLVAAYWLNMKDPQVVDLVDPRLLHALAHLAGDDRERVAEAWRGLVRRIPEGPAGKLFVDHVYGVETPDARIQLAMRDIDQGRADYATLNRLDAALYARQGASYEQAMAGAIDRFVATPDRVAKMRQLCHALVSENVHPTVKRVIEEHVLPASVGRLKASNWADVLSVFTSAELLGRGVPRLMLARAIGKEASDKTLRAFEELCVRNGYMDALDVAAAGRGLPGRRWRRISRAMGMG